MSRLDTIARLARRRQDGSAEYLAQRIEMLEGSGPVRLDAEDFLPMTPTPTMGCHPRRSGVARRLRGAP